MDSQNFANILHETVEMIVAYWRKNLQPEAPVLLYEKADILAERLNLAVPNQGNNLENLLPLMQLYLDYSVRTSGKKFFNQLWTGADITGVLAEMITTASNTSMSTYEIAPIATLIELELIKTLNNLVGFSEGEGIFVTGGSNANLIALLSARNKFLPSAKNQGVGDHKLVAFVSDQAHYSFLKAMNITGLGTDNLIKIPSDLQGRMIPSELERAIALTKSQGKIPFFVVATAGTTVLGAFDLLEEIATLCDRSNIWLHIDAAWGCPVLFSAKYQYLLKGSYLADSFTWDAHKLMGVPLICSAILIKQSGTLVNVCGSGDTDYIFHPQENQDYDLGVMSLQCGRKVDAFKLWLAWQYYGTQGYGQRVEYLLSLANYTAQAIQAHGRLKLILAPQFLNICFRYQPNNHLSADKVDQINLAIREYLWKSGKYLVNYAYYQGRVIIRLILANPDLQPSDMDDFLLTVVECGDRLLD
jgi:glutamate/tyrosine decarboxylase-like PLP-dependent enzyme